MIETLAPRMAADATHATRVAIVGGGILGLTLALRYRQAGRNVTVFDATERIDRRGHHVVASTDRAFLRLLAELGLGREVRWAPRDRAFSLRHDGPFGAVRSALASSAVRTRFGAVPGGAARILEALQGRAATLGVDLRTGTIVRSVRRDAEELIVEADGVNRPFDHVVVTLAAPLAAVVCDDLDDAERARLAGVEHSGIVCASFVVEHPPLPHYLTALADGRAAISAIVNTGAIDEKPHDLSVVYCSKAVSLNNELYRASDDEVAGRFQSELASLAPRWRRTSVVRSRVTRAPHTYASARLPEFSTSVPGLAIVNAAHFDRGSHHVERTVALANSAFRTLCAERLT